jgi:hypothetical protein
VKVAAPARKLIPAWLDGWDHQWWRGAGDTILPQLEGRGVHKREAAIVLTSVAPGRSVVRRCSVAVWLAGEEEEEAGDGTSSGKKRK